MFIVSELPLAVRELSISSGRLTPIQKRGLKVCPNKICSEDLSLSESNGKAICK